MFLSISDNSYHLQSKIMTHYDSPGLGSRDKSVAINNLKDITLLFLLNMNTCLHHLPVEYLQGRLKTSSKLEVVHLH